MNAACLAFKRFNKTGRDGRKAYGNVGDGDVGPVTLWRYESMDIVGGGMYDNLDTGGGLLK